MGTVRTFSPNPHNLLEIHRALRAIRVQLPPSSFDMKNTDPNVGVPTSTDDITQGWRIGSTWINEDTDIIYQCADNTENAAVWNRMISIAASESPLFGDVVAFNIQKGQFSTVGAKNPGSVLTVDLDEPTSVKWSATSAQQVKEHHFTLIGSGAAVAF